MDTASATAVVTNWSLIIDWLILEHDLQWCSVAATKADSLLWPHAAPKSGQRPSGGGETGVSLCVLLLPASTLQLSLPERGCMWSYMHTPQDHRGMLAPSRSGVGLR
ncbi:hypothetical protein KIL84_018830 [Mauremys mutica]|uniref:Uncharacterized protein n=1 Tax=Mauremys mutica TaxID=74926 RepID=A0A9D3XV66_9SAUR|nr:hypothetical protein KIL84_018830 [Mauremys mutica]